jgi:nucleotide-binding universal stress UspA family protein
MVDQTLPKRARTKFLVVVDESPECRLALRFAAKRARKTGGGVALLRVIEPAEFQGWGAVEKIYLEEAHAEAQEILQRLAAEVNDIAGIMPELVIRDGKTRDVILKLIEEDPGIRILVLLVIRDGKTRDVILKLIEEDPGIRILVLGASIDRSGPGPLVSSLAGQMSGSMRVPLTIVPGGLTPEEIDELV